jgi:predicted O-methyltransferase YrrM
MFGKKPKIKDLLPPPVKAHHGEYSMIFSSHDDARPTQSLIDLSMKLIQEAACLRLPRLSERLKSTPDYPNIWPGEHYRLLAAFVKAKKPKKIIEIGTATGLSALALKEFLPEDGRITTFDLIPWKTHPQTHLREDDFVDGRLVQYTHNLMEWENCLLHQKSLENADLFFIDATHDGDLEKILLHHIQKINKTFPLYLIFDDIRVWTMLKMWREIALPKIDLTSFGHWSGTGLVEISRP